MTDFRAVSAEINARLAPIFHEFQQAEMARIEKAAKADPVRYRLTDVMPRGTPLSSRHWGAVTDRRGRKIKFCWSVHRNVAGFYLGWREIETPIKRKRPAKVGEAVATITRDQRCARRVKKRLEELQKRRTDALRAKYPAKEPKTKTYWVNLQNGSASRGLGNIRAADEDKAMAAAKKRWGDREQDGWTLSLVRFGRR
jgi:hypothetical protein